jgi:hypothetical protein
MNEERSVTTPRYAGGNAKRKLDSVAFSGSRFADFSTCIYVSPIHNCSVLEGELLLAPSKTYSPLLLMKTHSPLLVFGALLLLAGLLAGSEARAGASATGDPVVIERGAHHRIWGRVTYHTNRLGRVSALTNSFTELAVGMHRNHGGQWVECSPVIELAPGGAAGLQTAHQIRFAANLNTPAGTPAVDLTTPDGKRLRTRILGLSYFDPVTGEAALIAETQDSIGLIVGDTQVVYTNAFDGVLADVQYINFNAGLEQNVVIRGVLPDPTPFGLGEAAVLQVLTEFLDPPVPAKQGPGANSLTVADFGEMQIHSGQAFKVGAANPVDIAPDADSVLRVKAQWLVLEGRTFLVEQVPVSQVDKALRDLQIKSQGASVWPKATGRGQNVLLALSERLPRGKPQPPDSKPVQLARAAEYCPTGLVLDYTALGTLTANTYRFKGDTTYYLSGPSRILISGEAIFEGGTVIKIAPTNSGGIVLNGSSRWLGSMYRPCIFTARDDSSVGEWIPASNPTNYCPTVLNHSASTTLSDCRFSYAGTAISAYGDLSLENVQFVRCNTPISAEESHIVAIRNGLFWSNNVVVSLSTWLDEYLIRGEHLTVCQPGAFLSGGFFDACNIYLTNSLLAGLSGWGTAVNELNTNQVAWLASDVGVFQTVGAASAYLSENSPFRNVGVTEIDSSLRAQLALRTTYPPLLLSGLFTRDTTLGPLVQRDTDQPDLGWHYAPLDYCLKDCSITKTLVLTNGLAVGVYSGSSSAGFHISSGGSLRSGGSPLAPIYIVPHNAVQEQSNTNWASTNWLTLVELAGGTARCDFTHCYLLAGRGNLLSATDPYSQAAVRNCQFSPGFVYVPLSFAATNCFWDSSWLELHSDDTCVWSFFNNTFRGGSWGCQLYDQLIAWNLAYDNLFLGTIIEAEIDDFSHGFNGYLTSSWRLAPTNANDVILTNTPVYRTGALGSFYYPTNEGMLSTLINAGSRSPAQAGLYHYTVKAVPGSKEGTDSPQTVDIGFHYLGTDANGNPLDYDPDGTPDYLEDSDGDSAVDSGETDWQIASDPGLKVLITRPSRTGLIP